VIDFSAYSDLYNLRNAVLSVFYEEKENEVFNRQFGILENLGIKSPLILDVGANIGQSVDHYRTASPSCVIHCFEPNPDAFEKLISHCHDRIDVKLLNIALTNYSGIINFYAARRSELSSLLRTESWLSALSSDDKYEATELCVPCTTLDQYCHEMEIKKVDVLKIDVQGAELIVLKGGQKMLSNARIGLVYLEVMLAETYVGQVTLAQLLEFFGTYRYRLWDLVPFTYTGAGAAWTANALFVCPQWAKQVEERSRRTLFDKTNI
jgi:FkbM family methyltransferase